ncbi:ABA4-like family protein [Lutimonas zeaxanthinifaciens]|nr:ABA4-like family protein [Lutimonas sp. YSD2104]WKK67598.1 ABA4-like family protein [Lutimonas sp. YSD2104]
MSNSYDTHSEVFSLANITAFLMWIPMIVLPKWKVTRFLIDFKVIPIFLAILYAFYIVQSILNGPAMDFGSLKAVMHLFTIEEAVLAGWLHYLVFDMLVGMWMLDKNKTLKIHQAIMAPCLLGTFMMGPVGFLLFMGVRKFAKKNN